MPKKPGRPKVKPSEKKSMRLAFAVTREEWKTLKAAASSRGLGLSEYLRLKVFGKR